MRLRQSRKYIDSQLNNPAVNSKMSELGSGRSPTGKSPTGKSPTGKRGVSESQTQNFSSLVLHQNVNNSKVQFKAETGRGASNPLLQSKQQLSNSLITTNSGQLL